MDVMGTIMDSHTKKALAAQKEQLELAHKQNLEGTIRRLVKAIELELGEIEVYLDRPSPNLEGVKNRIRDIRSLIRPHK